MTGVPLPLAGGRGDGGGRAAHICCLFVCMAGDDNGDGCGWGAAGPPAGLVCVRSWSCRFVVAVADAVLACTVLRCG